MPETDYTVASNEQLLGGNVRKTCECDDVTEASKEALERIGVSASEPLAHSPTESLETVGTSILDLYAPSSTLDTNRSSSTTERIDTFTDPSRPTPQSPNAGKSDLATHSSKSSTNSSVDTQELIDSFPVPPKLVIQRKTTPDLWLDTEVSEPNASKSAQKDERKASLSDIYFSPLHVSASRCELSSPLSSPLTTPTQQSFDASAQFTGSRSADLNEDGFAVSADQLDRLIGALVDSSMVQDRLQSQRTYPRTIETCDSESRHAPIASHKDLQQQYESKFRNRWSVIGAPRTRFCGASLVDPSIDGSPICMVSNNSDAATNIARIGELSHIETSKGRSVQCSLHAVSGLNNEQCKVRLQLVNKVLGRTTGKLKYLLVATIDVTESFTKAALFEVLNTTQARPEEINQVEIAIQSIPKLRSHTCTMQTLTLMSELDRIRDQFVDFYMVQTRGTHENGVPSRLAVPFVSEGLHFCLSVEDGEDLRHLIVGIIGKFAGDGKAFASILEWDGKQRRIHCIPLVDECKHVKLSWVCFARDGFDIGYW